MSTADDQLSDHQNFGVIEEFRTAYGLVKYGLGALQAIGDANDFYHPSFLLLASGLERVAKCVLAFKNLADHGCFPSARAFKKWGHDVARLLRQVADTCYSKQYLAIPAARADLDFLTSDGTCHEVISCLSYFGRHGRYDSLDLLAGEASDAPTARERWDALEMAIVKESPNWLQRISDPADEMYPEINRRIVATIENVVRALTRLFTIGQIHEDAKRYIGLYASFLFLTDDRLGATDYRPLILSGKGV